VKTYCLLSTASVDMPLLPNLKQIRWHYQRIRDLRSLDSIVGSEVVEFHLPYHFCEPDSDLDDEDDALKDSIDYLLDLLHKYPLLRISTFIGLAAMESLHPSIYPR
jgi:hypothetical protein